MIAKKHKLTTKEVNYLMRRKQSVYVDGYKILRCDQYTNNPYHQTGIQVSGKVHKHAVQRNIIRRAFYAAREDQIDKAIHNHYYKIFIIIHPEHCELINRVICYESKVKGEKQLTKDIPISQTAHQQLKSHFSSIIISTL
jgi:ribonuclease P protein component